ncbi:MAG: isopentenyl-diphosphate Delta-isomerase [Cyclobacteriaceae bacterium]|nr:isopentenyl-diphosphate Delta-isomerase [Cyclobacteriaceae bacterium]
MDHVVLVDDNDRAIGTMEKLEAHRKGLLHRAFSVLVYNSNGDILVQRRADSKYHSAGLWTNTCCSHPRPNESMVDACARRLREEMSIEAEPRFLYKFTYRVELGDGLVEHEVDHVFRATFDGQPRANPDEVQDWKFIPVADLLKDVAASPERYTYWFRLILEHQHPGVLAS